jgi:hypothetical protein
LVPVVVVYQMAQTVPLLLLPQPAVAGVVIGVVPTLGALLVVRVVALTIQVLLARELLAKAMLAVLVMVAAVLVVAVVALLKRAKPVRLAPVVRVVTGWPQRLLVRLSLGAVAVVPVLSEQMALVALVVAVRVVP